MDDWRNVKCEFVTAAGSNGWGGHAHEHLDWFFETVLSQLSHVYVGSEEDRSLRTIREEENVVPGQSGWLA